MVSEEIKKQLIKSGILDENGNVHEGSIVNGYWWLVVLSDYSGKQYLESRELDEDQRIQRVSTDNLPISPMRSWAKPIIEYLEPKLNKK